MAKSCRDLAREGITHSEGIPYSWPCQSSSSRSKRGEATCHNQAAKHDRPRSDQTACDVMRHESRRVLRLRTGRSGPNQQRRGALRPLGRMCPCDASWPCSRCAATTGTRRTMCDVQRRSWAVLLHRANEDDWTTRHSSADFLHSVSSEDFESIGARIKGERSTIWHKIGHADRTMRSAVRPARANHESPRIGRFPPDNDGNFAAGTINDLNCEIITQLSSFTNGLRPN